MAKKSKVEEVSPLEAKQDFIIEKDFVELIDERFTNYAFAVMEDRALPDARDGLKPSQRRTLVAMNDLNLRSSGKTKKCAKICGDVSGNYHPHGEAVVYPTLVRMAQDWSLRYPLISPQGNFGSPAPEDKPAAMRYTEAKFSVFGDQMVSELSNQVVNYISNYNDELTEPTVMPSLIPNLIINGCSGIAVGWATSMAPHNLREIANLIDAYIKNPDLSIEDIMEIVPGPDFPLPCKILGNTGIKNYFSTGRGTVHLEGYHTIESEKNGQQYIKITALPYGGSAESFCREIKELVETKKIEGITNLKNLTNKKGMDIRIWIHKQANINVVLNLVLKHTSLRTNFSVNSTVLLDGKKVVENVPLLKLVETFVTHRKDVLTRKFNAELDKNNRRLHILDGLIGITTKIDAVIKLIREADDRNVAQQELIAKGFVTSVEQAEAVLKITLGNLTKLDTSSMADEFSKLTKRNEWLTDQLSSDIKMLKLISKEQLEIAEKLGDDRRSEIVPSMDDFNYEDLISEEQIVVSLTKDGYIKRVPLDTFKSQGRGGKGVIAVKGREEDEAADIFVGSTHDLFLFFTNQGNLLKKKGYEIPMATRTTKGIHTANLLALAPGESVASTIATKSLDIDGYFVMVTKNGLIKRSEIREYNTSLRKRGLKALTLVESDELVHVTNTNGDKDVVLVTSEGFAVRYSEDNVRSVGRAGQGVKAMNLKVGDSIISMMTLDLNESNDILVITENGFGKKTNADEYKSLSGRVAKGSRTINTEKISRNGRIVCAAVVSEGKEFLVLTQKGKMIRLSVEDFRSKGKATTGNKIVGLDSGDKVQTLVVVDQGAEKGFNNLNSEEAI
jgi:DNA gyrase subunit A